MKSQTEMDLGVRFKPPTLLEVVDWGFLHGLPVHECEKFHSYFSSNGWHVGRVKMKSWRDAANHWRLNMIQGQSKAEAKGKRTVYELTKIIEANQRIADDLKARYYRTVAAGGQWDNAAHRKQYLDTKAHITELNQQLAGM